ncbi:hypothetical protein ACJ5NV_16310 [Loktanella agnita]|uniref:hypothetical protein n=1 Tax=Loktanella agnita TaxID=287097 RepID=UPI00398A3BB2
MSTALCDSSNAFTISPDLRFHLSPEFPPRTFNKVPIPTDALAGVDFDAAFTRFQDLLTRFDEPFTRFDEGLIEAWESYKPRVRRVALDRMIAEDWTPEQIGLGAIVARVISAIEIQAIHGDLTNNMVFWQKWTCHALVPPQMLV